MQFAYLTRTDGAKRLVSTAEYFWLTDGQRSPFLQGEVPEEATEPFYLAYGCFKGQPGMTAEATLMAAQKAQDHWHQVLHDDAWDGLAIQDLVTHLPIAEGTIGAWMVPVAALIQAPPRVIEQMRDRSVQAVVATLQYADLDPLTAVLNREGLFAFLSLEQRKGSIEKATWQDQVDHARMDRTAERIR